jgi:uncharacterized membrane protein
MFNGLLKSLYENQVLILYELLKSLGAKVTIATIDDILHEHPDYPSFLSITDSLEKWNVDSLAIQTSADKLDEIPVPFITSFKQGYFIAVASVNKSEIKIIDENGYKKVLDKDWFLKQWTETIVVVEANEKSGETFYKKKFNQSLLKSIGYTLLPITFLIAILWPFINGTAGIVPTAYLLLKLFGFTVSLLLLWYDIDKGNPLLKQICSGIQKANCNAVLNTKAASLFGILTWSEVGFLYFAGGLLFVAFTGINETLPLLSGLSLLAFPYIFFSIYYQWKVVKQWCVLCLLVQSVLLLETILVLTGTQISVESALIVFSNNYASAIISITIPTISWFLLKPLLKKLQAAKHEKRNYLQLKYNDQIFWSLLQKQKSIHEHSTEGLGITIGNPQAKNTIVKVCNPYCGPCSTSHQAIEKLVASLNDLKVQIIYTASSNETDFLGDPVRKLLAIRDESNCETLSRALSFWYSMNNREIYLFNNEFNTESNPKDYDSELDAMRFFCDKIKIKYTPTVFLNGYELPDKYSISDIEYFVKN